MDKNKTSGPTISCAVIFYQYLVTISLNLRGGEGRGGNGRINVLLKSVCVFYTRSWLAHTLGYLDACPASVASPYQALYLFNYSPLLLLGSLARIISHRRANLFLMKLRRKRGKSRRGRSCGEAFFRRSKILIAPSIAHCDWVVYAVNTGDKLMGHWLLAVPAWWQKNYKNKHSFGPLSASAHRKNAGMPD